MLAILMTIGISAKASVSVMVQNSNGGALAETDGIVTYSAEGTAVTLTVTPANGKYLVFNAEEKGITALAAIDAGNANVRTRTDGISIGGSLVVTPTGSDAYTDSYGILHGGGVFSITAPNENTSVVVTVNFKDAIEITDEHMTLDSEYDLTYDGTAKEPGVTVTISETTIDAENYTVSYGDANTNAGDNTASVTVTGKGAYYGEVTKNFSIAAKSIEGEDVTVEPIADQRYTASAITPGLIVKIGETTLVAGDDKDYTVTYVNNTEVSTDEAKAQAVVNGRGNYTGSRTVEFKIIGSGTDSEGNEVSYGASGTMLSKAVVDNNTVSAGSEVTAISDDAFSELTNEEKASLETIDLSNTQISGIEVSRQSGAFSGISAGTLIYVPAGNSVAADETNVVVGDDTNGRTCVTLSLDENSTIPFEPLHDFTATNVALNRDFSSYVSDDMMATVFLPFALTAEQVGELGEFYAFDKIENKEVKLVTPAVTTTEANTPYIFKPKTGTTTMSLTGSIEVKSLTGSENTGTLKGTFEKIDWTSETLAALPTGTSIYGFAGETVGTIQTGAFVKVKAGASIAPFRAYLEVTGTAGARLQYPVAFGGNGATGIDTISQGTTTQKWYTLDGRQLYGEPKAAGVYIKAGKKQIIK